MATGLYGTNCRNPRCLAPLDQDDQVNLPRLSAHGFCPGCRHALAMGSQAGAAFVGLGGFLFAVIVQLGAWWFQ